MANLPKYYKTITDCPVTLTTSHILYPYIIDHKDPWYTAYGGFNSGMDIECSYVYSICPCKVTYVGVGENKVENVVIVQYTSDISFRYSHLSSLDVKVNDLLAIGQRVGKANRYCKFELLTSGQGNSLWVARVGKKQYYPQDPEEYVDGSITLLGSGLVNPNDDDVDIDAVLSSEDFPETTLDLYGDGW